MFDIFQEKEQPQLYIADITLQVKIPTRSKKTKTYNVRFIKLEKYPVVLLNGEFPTNKSKLNFFKKIYEEKINKNNYQDIIFIIQSIENIKFSSKLGYKFDYDKH